MATILKIKNLRVAVGNQEILQGVSLNIRAGEIHLIMGPNGSGKSTLLSAIMGHPKYKVTAGEATLNKINLLKLPVTKRAQAGIFLGFQHPISVPGVGLGNFIRTASNTIETARQKNFMAIGPAPFAAILKEQMTRLKMDQNFIGRSINDGFSGGEKKKAEILQLALLKPAIAFLDEIDSGLDIDALKIVIKELLAIQKKQKFGLALVSHNPKILDLIEPDKIHIMSQGKIIADGGNEIVKKIEAGGYDSFLKK